jgi:hypothetical protein
MELDSVEKLRMYIKELDSGVHLEQWQQTHVDIDVVIRAVAELADYICAKEEDFTDEPVCELERPGKGHWIYLKGTGKPLMPLRSGRLREIFVVNQDENRLLIRVRGSIRYAIRKMARNGLSLSFAPDELVDEILLALFGKNRITEDEPK